jgi:hypothetical protein
MGVEGDSLPSGRFIQVVLITMHVQYENAEGTFKTKDETAGNKNKYVAILAVLLVVSSEIYLSVGWEERGPPGRMCSFESFAVTRSCSCEA